MREKQRFVYGSNVITKLRIVIAKPSKYLPNGYVERFRWGFMPNSTLPHIRSMTPAMIDDIPVEVHTIDDYVHSKTDYLSLLKPTRGTRTLLALVGVQSHQSHRSLELAALAIQQGCMTVIGGPHAIICDTSMLHGNRVSFALAEAELIWRQIIQDSSEGTCAGS